MLILVALARRLVVSVQGESLEFTLWVSDSSNEHRPKQYNRY